jgi:hypothetical protein
MKKTRSLKKERVKLEELGLYIRTINIDYKPKNNKELANLISEHFNLICLEIDIEQHYVLYEHYEELSKIDEDYELDFRREEYFRNLGKSNPFY